MNAASPVSSTKRNANLFINSSPRRRASLRMPASARDARALVCLFFEVVSFQMRTLSRGLAAQMLNAHGHDLWIACTSCPSESSGAHPVSRTLDSFQSAPKQTRTVKTRAHQYCQYANTDAPSTWAEGSQITNYKSVRLFQHRGFIRPLRVLFHGGRFPCRRI